MFIALSYLCFKEGDRVPVTGTLPALLDLSRLGKRIMWVKVTLEVQAICQPVKRSLCLICLCVSCLSVVLSWVLARITLFGSPKPLCTLPGILLPSEPSVTSFCPPCLPHPHPQLPTALFPLPSAPHSPIPSLSVSLLFFSLLPKATHRFSP